MLKIMGIAGSPRKNGNSTTLMEAMIDGASDLGADSEIVYLNDILFKGCQGCSVCVPAGSCILTDDLTPVLAALPEADIWILAAPIYFCGVSGQLKLFFDRCHCMVTWDGGKVMPQLEGKRAAAVIVTYEADRSEGYLRRAQSLRDYLKWFGDFEPREVICEERLKEVDAARNRPELLERVRSQGRKLAADLLRRRGGS